MASGRGPNLQQVEHREHHCRESDVDIGNRAVHANLRSDGGEYRRSYAGGRMSQCGVHN